MNIHHLELFYYVARFGGITEAVRNMPYGIQQPAISGQIAQLEEHLGVTLFHRRPFALTRRPISRSNRRSGRPRTVSCCANTSARTPVRAHGVPGPHYPCRAPFRAETDALGAAEASVTARNAAARAG